MKKEILYENDKDFVDFQKEIDRLIRTLYKRTKKRLEEKQK